MKRPSLFDLFLILLVLLAGLSIYFSFVKPIRFSHLIQREGVSRYAEVEILLPDDLSWMEDVLPAAEESRNVFGQIDWQVIGFGEEALGDKKITKATAKVLIVEESSGILRYGKYTLVKGNKIFLINDRYFIEGRILDFRLLDEKIKI
ncbi:MAG: hypothetical protein HYU34_02910 [Candidatus Omnitrophica bacterium]|nr:hypothetical protein [Candidatus Omnitrophota bacterium]